jgi:hypothetical protein
MRKMGINKNYVLGVYDDSSTIQNLTIKQKSQELTEFFSRFKYFGPIIKGLSVNEVLDKACETDAKFCVVQCVGHLIKTHQFFLFLEKWMESQTFFITGHIMDNHNPNSHNPSGNQYYGLHKQCLLVNLDYYKKFDRPVYGDKTSTTEHVLAKAKRHSKDIHDDYTPLSLMPTEDTCVCTPLVDGWNFINKSLENGLTVYNFHPKIRAAKQYLYPGKGAEVLQNQLAWINNIVTYAKDCVFTWNTENYIDLKYTIFPADKKVKKLYSVAAAFKPNMILETFGFDDNTEVIFYDYSKQSLAFKKLLIEQWDGEDYPSFLRYAIEKYKVNVTGGNETQGLNDSQLWHREIIWWGGADKIKDNWLRYKKLNHKYIHVDICDDPQKITRHVTNEENSIIWWSNAFHTVNAHYVRGLQGVINCYNEWLKLLNEKNQNLYILGKDYLDRPIEGGTLKEYLNEYRQT